MATVRFKRSTIRQFMAKHYPGCPHQHRQAIIYQTSKRAWVDATIGKAVGIITTNYIRHRLTAYERLMHDHGLTRAEARVAEAGTVADILRLWRTAESPRDVPVERIITIIRRTGGDDERG